MTISGKRPYSYRDDPAIPAFPDDKPLFIFDGVCVLCSGLVLRLIRSGKGDRFRFASAQSPLGKALYQHFGAVMDETYLLIDQGQAYEKSAGYLRTTEKLGGWWLALKVLYLVPRTWRDWVYDIVARHRYKWFGRTGYCAIIPASYKDKLLS
ncbi:MAG: DCC1-like thiol-disulfide oxidoreductase family protein [Pseudomonadota bacterium]|nr:DCC1-like thiol-disulfide oxidoreductase family protein [Pseudomonadota bacterium]